LWQENILIKKNGEPCICDFGCSRITDQRGFTTALSGTPAFSPPEFFPSNQSQNAYEEHSMVPTVKSDVYSYGLLILLVTFPVLSSTSLIQTVSRQVITGQPPKKPQNHWTTPRDIRASLRPQMYYYQTGRKNLQEAGMTPLDEGIWDLIWELMNQCCDDQPERRPDMKMVQTRLTFIEFGSISVGSRHRP
jgi:serine/threonine protein kinase